MLPAIHLDNNSELMTGEVGEVRTDRRLPSEVMLLERGLPQVLPSFLFGFRRVTPQRARAQDTVVYGSLRVMWHPPPTPDPSPPRAGGREQVRAC
jgi:hypothetical protein